MANNTLMPHGSVKFSPVSCLAKERLDEDQTGLFVLRPDSLAWEEDSSSAQLNVCWARPSKNDQEIFQDVKKGRGPGEGFLMVCHAWAYVWLASQAVTVFLRLEPLLVAVLRPQARLTSFTLPQPISALPLALVLKTC